ncbi:hypothetical protein [Capsulimonas corticalis]|nr:hypothetical protein [Capsulimonas corticalis]
MTLITATGDALFVWRSEEFRKDDQWGVECSVFRNEGSVQSSLMIREAVEAAVVKWKPQRFFTFVNAEKVQSANPGYCFKMAGWSFCGFTKAGLHILEYRN